MEKKTVTITVPEDAEILINGVKFDIKEVKAFKRWMPEEDEDFYYIDFSDNTVENDTYSGDDDDISDFVKIGNIYPTFEDADKILDRTMLMVELEDFASECNYGLKRGTNVIQLFHNGTGWAYAQASEPWPLMPYFILYSDAQKAIEKFGSRLDLLK